MMRKSRIALASMLLTALACGILTGCGKENESSYDNPLDSADKEKLSELAMTPTCSPAS